MSTANMFNLLPVGWVERSETHHCVIRGRSGRDDGFRYALPILRSVVAAGRASASRGFRRSCRSSTIKTNDMLDHILQHLTALVSFDTRNHPDRKSVV